jgi:hypothetical protein
LRIIHKWTSSLFSCKSRWSNWGWWTYWNKMPLHGKGLYTWKCNNFKKNQICITWKWSFEVEAYSRILLSSSGAAFNNVPSVLLFYYMDTEGNDFRKNWNWSRLPWKDAAQTETVLFGTSFARFNSKRILNFIGIIVL